MFHEEGKICGDVVKSELKLNFSVVIQRSRKRNTAHLEQEITQLAF